MSDFTKSRLLEDVGPSRWGLISNVGPIWGPRRFEQSVGLHRNSNVIPQVGPLCCSHSPGLYVTWIIKRPSKCPQLVVIRRIVPNIDIINTRTVIVIVFFTRPSPSSHFLLPITIIILKTSCVIIVIIVIVTIIVVTAEDRVAMVRFAADARHALLRLAV